MIFASPVVFKRNWQRNWPVPEAVIRPAAGHQRRVDGADHHHQVVVGVEDLMEQQVGQLPDRQAPLDVESLMQPELPVSPAAVPVFVAQVCSPVVVVVAGLPALPAAASGVALVREVVMSFVVVVLVVLVEAALLAGVVVTVSLVAAVVVAVVVVAVGVCRLVERTCPAVT